MSIESGPIFLNEWAGFIPPTRRFSASMIESFMDSLCPIAVDIMGGDHAPRVTLEGSFEALEAWPNLELHLVGPESLIQPEINRLSKKFQERVQLVPANDVIEMNESPVKALRKKRNSSIAVAAAAMQSGTVQGLFSAGPTGATVAAVCFSSQMLQGVRRPGIAVTFPGLKGPVVLCDVGANVSCRSVHLQQYAVMASVYCQAIHRIEKPRVALLNIGTEEGKGNQLSQDAHALLKECAAIHFTGLIEGHELMTGKADVVVCDGFTGNIVLKSSEGVGSLFLRRFRDALARVPEDIQRQIFEDLEAWTDYAAYGGAPLLGISGCAIIGHGRSDKRAIRNGIGVASDFARLEINTRIIDSLRSINNKG